MTWDFAGWMALGAFWGAVVGYAAGRWLRGRQRTAGKARMGKSFPRDPVKFWVRMARMRSWVVLPTPAAIQVNECWLILLAYFGSAFRVFWWAAFGSGLPEGKE